ncbi:MAG: DUF4157 domain-containing protein, partial [Leptolyngbya sp. SIO3F4]|nr:DUF4157 domain-containing protein [Leptolyngbya sp. SIO3F4]
MKTADVSSTHSQQHQAEQSTSSVREQDQAFFSEQSSDATPFFPSAGFPNVQAKSSSKPFFQPSRVPTIQPKCTAYAEEEHNRCEEGAGDLPKSQKMSTFGDDGGEDANVIQSMPAFESDEAPVQAKLTIGQPGDKYEQEADSMADQVMAMPEPGAKRIETQSKASIQRFYFPSSEALQQKSLNGQHILQTKGQNGSTGTSHTLENRLNSSKGRGTPLSKETRTFMENRFGQDFSAVRVHTGSESAQMNKDLGALAFTHSKMYILMLGNIVQNLILEND